MWISINDEMCVTNNDMKMQNVYVWNPPHQPWHEFVKHGKTNLLKKCTSVSWQRQAVAHKNVTTSIKYQFKNTEMY